jgi:hypothetical protein
MQKKAQSAIEFIVVLMSVMVFFMLFIAAIEFNRSESLVEKRGAMLDEIALGVRDEINLAAGATDGYSRQFMMPDNVLGLEFNITLVGNFIYLKTIDDKYALGYPVHNVTGYAQTGSNIIEKINGTIYLNRV